MTKGIYCYLDTKTKRSCLYRKRFKYRQKQEAQRPFSSFQVQSAANQSYSAEQSVPLSISSIMGD